MPSDRKSVLIRADPSLWSKVEAYAKGEGVARNEAVLRLLAKGLEPKPKKASAPVLAPEAYLPIFPAALRHKLASIEQTMREGPARLTLDVQLGPAPIKPGERLKKGSKP